MAGTHTLLEAQLTVLAKFEGGMQFMGWPERWWGDHRFRCPNDHVSTVVLKCETPPHSRCLACREPVYLTFPEDREGPLVSVPGGC